MSYTPRSKAASTDFPGLLGSAPGCANGLAVSGRPYSQGRTAPGRRCFARGRRNTRLHQSDLGAGLRLLVGIRFQVLFTPLAGVLFTFPSRYWFTIGRQRVFSLGGWSPQFPTGFHVSRGTQDTASSPAPFRLQGFHLLWPTFPRRSSTAGIGNSTLAVLQPPGHLAEAEVWAVPRSLAATDGIAVAFSSSGY